MLDKIIRFSIDNKLIIGLLTMGLIVWGSYSLTQLPIDAVPDITNNQVQVITTSPTLAAEEVERLITFPIEITMATIPDIEEIRSFSRFGLSVVTLVFKQKVDVYWARQQVNERMAEAESQIPMGVGKPSMAPITTGLGEIYQYVIGTAPGYEDQYDARALRSIQDWIVRRQLLGTPGVADVSSFGGYMKQYEIAIDPDRIKSMNVSIKDIFQALESNNENTGGAYIEKNKQALFIRSEGLVKNLKDIAAIRIKNSPKGIPILIGDVGQVQIGSAVRYGATTRNGQGEVVSAIVMMLKGENSAQVIEDIKSRIEEIRKTLPEGITIEPFLDRTKLVNNAIGTVTQNLTEGALIVIFVLLLLLGNFRAGIIVASVIPLALLFAFSMMNLFGVSGNLMSLGAIDFGLIVDGAVIIVEATMHHLGMLHIGRRLTQDEMDHEVYQSASKIRNSAAFGEIIILIVYLPILALVGTEGKMFGPMAQTVAFAILGAFILSLTYIPMVSSLFLSKTLTKKQTISDRIMRVFHGMYDPSIRWAMRTRPLILGSTAILFLCAILVFSRLGGEFIPTLEEGDFAVETRVLTGSSLENTISATSQAEKILLAQFPEVLQVVSKIGAGEIPTDPMPVEGADLMIILKDKSEWVSASNREELANKMAQALEVIAGVNFGFQQPIQMRFNELMTGVRQDVAIKVYGDDLTLLTAYARQIGAIAGQVQGAKDIYVEEVTGVPQIVIDYNRTQLAKFGLSIHEVNQTIEAAFAGAAAGLVYEGEQRYDLVVRLSGSNRNDFEDVRNLYISRPDGHQIPLYQVAEVRIEEGPYQIQRDDTRRRIIVAFNVRDRDVESVVHEIRLNIDQAMVMAPGYAVTYGGQFENLVKAQERLSVAVPLALLLILILLYFTFGSIKHSLLIFTAIPLSAIGGIFALWIRGMPFSISAGVGFIALFGVAVLNGIVLIAEFNRLKSEGMTDVFERIYVGTSIRLRPVIMTASVASLGFIPMALSNSSGAEVQKPLATVVIGGLISATFLTLVVLPILYYYFDKGVRKGASNVAAVLAVLAFSMCMPNRLKAQENPRLFQSVDEAIQMAVANNPMLKARQLEVEQNKSLLHTGWNLPKTNVSWVHGQYNSVYSNDNQWNISQTLAFPTVYTNQSRLARSRLEATEYQRQMSQNELIWEVKSRWYTLWLAMSKAAILQEQDSIFRRYAAAADIRFETGESNLLEKATATAEVARLQVMIAQNESDIEIYKTQLMALLNLKSGFEFKAGVMKEKPQNFLQDTAAVTDNPSLAWFRQQIIVAEQEKAVEKARILPDITLGYSNQSLNGPAQDIDGQPVTYTSADRFSSIQIGLSIPIFGARAQISDIRAAELKTQTTRAQLEAAHNEVLGQYQALLQEYRKYKQSLVYYNTVAMPNSNLILSQAQKGFEGGEIGYVEYTQGLNRVLNIKFNYLETLHQYNQTIIKIEFILGVQN